MKYILSALFLGGGVIALPFFAPLLETEEKKTPEDISENIPVELQEEVKEAIGQ